ncbi:MAG: phosphopantetheine-binding protein, partial [Algiphilus sp.]
MADRYEAPRTELESVLAGIWGDLLGVDRVGIHDNFFALGGDSLLTTRIVSSIRKELGFEPRIKDLFDHPTISLLSGCLESHGVGASLPSPSAGPRPEHIPLSYSQERLWFIDRFEGSRHYHIPWVLRLGGTLDIAALEGSLRGLVDRH